MFKKILVPLDGTDLAEGVLPYVSQLASGLNAPLVLLLVIDPHSVDAPEDPPGASQKESVAAEASKYLAAVAERLEPGGIQVETTTAFGRTADEIVAVAERESCGLIAMSTHGRTAFSRAILGSVTDKGLHSTHLPVLTIAPERAEAYSQGDLTLSRILVPLDGSPLAESVLPYVEELARAMSLEVILVRVMRLPSTARPYSATLLYYGEHVDVDVLIQKRCEEYLRATAETLQEKGLRVTWRVLKGAVARAIDQLAREIPHDIVIIATHGRSGIRRWRLGSVAEAVVRSSGDPVLIMPPSEQV